jgi:outer membrane protein assembly factor BamB
MDARRPIRWLLAATLLSVGWTAHGANPIGWRGDGTGHYGDANPPTTWSETQNVRWSAALPSWGNGSPVVVGDIVFVTVEPTWLVAIDRRTGTTLWKAQNRVLDAVGGAERAEITTRLTHAEGHASALKEEQRKLSRLKRTARKASRPGDSKRLAGELEAATARVTEARDALEASRALRTPPTGDIIGYASSTPVSDGKRVFALFGNGVVSAFDLEGKRLWSRWFRNSPKIRSRFLMHGHTEGHAASPRLVAGILVVGFGSLMGLDPSTGKTRWDAGTFRDYGTPGVLKVAGETVIVTAEGRRIRADDGVALPSKDPHTFYTSPVIAGGRVYVTGATSDDAGQPRARASLWSTTGAEGPIWTTDLDRARYHVSPLVHHGLIYTLSVRGRLRVLRAKDGSLVYEEKLALERPQVSFSHAGGLLYIFGSEGRALVLRPGERFEVVASNRLGPMRATPSFVGDAIYVRTHDRLYCLGE